MPRPGEKMSDEQRQKIAQALIARGLTPTKLCPRCMKTLPRSSFGRRKNGRYSASQCLECSRISSREWNKAHPATVTRRNRRTTLRRYFGITVEDYERLVGLQGGVCAICHRTDPRRTYLVVDHDHRTNRIRGLLCSLCNTAIGMLEDNPEFLSSAIEYLGSPPAPDGMVAKPHVGRASGGRRPVGEPQSYMDQPTLW